MPGKVPLHCARAEKQLGADLRVCLPAGGEARDLHLLGGQFVECLDRALAHRLARGQQFAAGRRRMPPCPSPRASCERLAAAHGRRRDGAGAATIRHTGGVRGPASRGFSRATAGRSTPDRAARPRLPRPASPPRAHGFRAPSPCLRNAQSERVGRADQSPAPLAAAHSSLDQLRQQQDRRPRPRAASAARSAAARACS